MAHVIVIVVAGGFVSYHVILGLATRIDVQSKRKSGVIESGELYLPAPRLPRPEKGS